MGRGNGMARVLAVAFVTVGCWSFLPGAWAATYWVPMQELVLQDGEAGDNFGRSVSISADRAIVGAMFDDTNWGQDSGSAHIYEQNGSTWAPVPMPWPTPPHPESAGHLFGTSVSIDGDLAIVGAEGPGPIHDDQGNRISAAYIFTRINSDWASLNWVVPQYPPGDTAPLGNSVSISRSTGGFWQGLAIVGAYFDDDKGPSSGSAYVFSEPMLGLSSWEQWGEKLLASDGASGDWFGESVAVSNTTAIVGAPHNNDRGTNSGSAYIFDVGRETPLGTQTNTEREKLLLPDDVGEGDLFGYSVALDHYPIVGAPHSASKLGAGTGSAYVFPHWRPHDPDKLLAPDGEADDQFGVSVSISGGTAVVGADWNDNEKGENAGAAYVYFWDPMSDKFEWEATLLASDGQPGDHFGTSVSISGDKIIVGAPGHGVENGQSSGSAYIFQRQSYVEIVLGPEIAAHLWGGAGTVGGVHVVFEEVTRPGIFRSDFRRPADQAALEDFTGSCASSLIDFDFASDLPQLWNVSFDGDFSGQTKLVLGYDDSNLLVDERFLSVRQFVGQQWTIPDQVLDMEKNTITLTVGSFGLLALSAQVPEPSALVLLAAGGSCLLLWRGRRRWRNAA